MIKINRAIPAGDIRVVIFDLDGTLIDSRVDLVNSVNAMLAHYGRHFPLVELNYTFYRPPTASALAALAEKSPAGFRFVVKGRALFA